MTRRILMLTAAALLILATAAPTCDPTGECPTGPIECPDGRVQSCYCAPPTYQSCAWECDPS